MGEVARELARVLRLRNSTPFTMAGVTGMMELGDKDLQECSMTLMDELERVGLGLHAPGSW